MQRVHEVSQNTETTGDGSSSIVERPVFTEEQIHEILQNWESSVSEKPHNPIEGQLPMEQAIAVGKADLAFFCEQGIFPVRLAAYKYEFADMLTGCHNRIAPNSLVYDIHNYIAVFSACQVEIWRYTG